MLKLLISLLILIATTGSTTTESEDLLFDFDEVFGIKRKEKSSKPKPTIKTDKLGFTLCYDCGKRVLNYEREDSIQQFGHPLCFRCMSKKYIEEHGIDDSAEQEKIKQMFQVKYWRGSK